MTNINKTIETILFASLGAMNMLGVMEGKTSDSAIKLRDETVEKVLKALKTQEQEHQKKLEELERECVGRKGIKALNALDEDSDKFFSGYNLKRHEIKETFRTINKT